MGSHERERQDQDRCNNCSDTGELRQEQRQEDEEKGPEATGCGSAGDRGGATSPGSRSECPEKEEGELGAVQAQIAQLKAELNIA
jgi:hypothetical protein